MNCSTHGLLKDTLITLTQPNPTYPYATTPDKIILYSNATDYFTNSNLDICGILNNCILLSAGCSNPYSSDG